MPPPHLHPRSSYTTSLFTTTLAISFLVVGLPHILPCPAPRVMFADEDSSQARRERETQPVGEMDSTGKGDESKVAELGSGLSQQRIWEEERRKMLAKAHECPVPKPGGRIGQLLGFTGGGEEKVSRENRSQERR